MTWNGEFIDLTEKDLKELSDAVARDTYARHTRTLTYILAIWLLTLTVWVVTR